MSKSYALRLAMGLLLTEEANQRRGRMTVGFDVLAILARERMTELLVQVLTRQGWEAEGARLVKKDQGVIWRLDPETRQVEIDLSGLLDQAITLQATSSPTVPVGAEAGNLESLGLAPGQADYLRDRLAQMTREEGDRLVREALLARRGVNEALKDVYREALKEKAATLGNIVSITESSQDGNLRIRLEIQ